MNRFWKYALGGGLPILSYLGLDRLGTTAKGTADAYYGSRRSEAMFGDAFDYSKFVVMGAGLGAYAAGAGIFSMARGAAMSRAFGTRASAGIIGRTAKGGFSLVGKGIKKGYPYIGAAAAGMLSSASLYPNPVAEGAIDNVFRDPTYTKLNYNTAGLPLRLGR